MLPEKGNEKIDVNGRGDNPTEANVHRGKSDFQRWPMILSHSHNNFYHHVFYLLIDREKQKVRTQIAGGIFLLFLQETIYIIILLNPSLLHIW